MNVSDIVDRLQLSLATTKDDATFNVICKLINRVSHQGSLFEKPLNEAEQVLVMKYAGIGNRP